jgi:prepilin-type N-terminal cleavage/methylation domain-containing protein
MSRARQEAGFSLIELLVATCVFLVITSIVATALRQITHSQSTVWNRTQMHSGLRGATELLQQEVGQAGRAAPPHRIVTSRTSQVKSTPPASAL